MYLRPASWAQATQSSRLCLVRTDASLISMGRFRPAITSALVCSITEMARFDGVPPNMSVSRITPAPEFTRSQAARMSLRRFSMSSSGPMQMAATALCGPTTCSMAKTNSSASRPCVTITRPIMSTLSTGIPTRLRQGAGREGGLIRPFRAGSKMLQCATQFRRCGGFKREEIQRRQTQPNVVFDRRFGHSFDRSAPNRQRDAAERHGRLGHDAEAADFHEARQAVGRQAIEPALAGPDQGPVVGHQPEAVIEAPQGQVALARPRLAADQHAPPAAGQEGRDQAGVDDHRRASGRVMMKRAPAILPSAPRRFSARIDPPWAAAIWRAME